MKIISDKIVITRKKHICFACGRMFEKGSKMRAQVNTYDGIRTIRNCLTCSELMSKYKSKFFDDSENIFWESCVNEYLEKDQTPEQLLEILNSKQNE